METLRDVVVLLHIVGFAITFGAWVTEAATKQFRTNRLMDLGLLLSLVTGLVLAAPWPAGIELNYVKIGVKLGVLIVLGGLIGAGNARRHLLGDRRALTRERRHRRHLVMSRVR